MKENKDRIRSENEVSLEEKKLKRRNRIAEINGTYKTKADIRPAIILLSIALVLFLTCIGLFVWNIIRMHSYESDYVKMYGKVVDVKAPPGNYNSIAYYLVISYTYEGKEYTFTDNVGRKEFGYSDIGKRAQIYVNPQNPDQAIMVMSSGSISSGYACCFCFFCFCYALGMIFLLGSIGTSFVKRLCFVWGMEIFLGIALFLLPWVGFPNSGFGEVFSRIDGSIAIIFVCGLVFLAMCADGAIMHYARSYGRRH